MQSHVALYADQRSAVLAANSTSTPRDANFFIKGNISQAGQIFHMSYSSDYNITRIDENRGERWFCSEVGAEDAGWRVARN